MIYSQTVILTLLFVVIAIVIGIYIGYSVSRISFYRKNTIGTLRIETDKYDPSEPPYIFLELNNDPGKIEKSQHIVLKVKSHKNAKPQE